MSIAEQLSDLKAQHARIRAMRVYGVEDRELSHNRILHWILDGGAGPSVANEFLSQLLAAGSSMSMEFEKLRKLGVRNIRCTFQAWAGGKNRPDEIVLLEDARGGQTALLMELKCQADPDPEQLKRYVDEATSRLTGVRPLPVLIQLAEPAIVACDFGYPVIALSALRTALREASALAATPAREILADYAGTLEFLESRDRAVVEHADELGRFFESDDAPGDAFERWLREQRVWAQRRILELVSRDLAPQWESAVMADANGAFIDFHPKGLGCYEGENGALFFFKWRLGIGLEVHAIAWPYVSAPPRTSMESLKVLVEEGAKTLKCKPSARLKRSGMLLRESNDIYGPQAILKAIAASVEKLSPLLGGAAATVAKRLGMERR